MSKEPRKVVAVGHELKEPGQVRPEPVKVEVDVTDMKPDTVNTVLYLLYLLYESHVIQRNHLKIILGNVGKDLPDNMLEYLVKESVK